VPRHSIPSRVSEVTALADTQSFAARKESVLGETDYDIHDAALAAIVSRRSLRWTAFD
jgi:hypothetical protein